MDRQSIKQRLKGVFYDEGDLGLSDCSYCVKK